MTALCCVVSAISTNLITLCVFRFFVGFGLSGSFVYYDLVAELSPSNIRAKILMLMIIMGGVGSILVNLFAWLTLSYYGWRVLTVASAVPLFISLILSFMYLPESPRWLISKKRVDDATILIQDIAVNNNMNIGDFTLATKIDYSHDPKSVMAQLMHPISLVRYVPIWIADMMCGFMLYGAVAYTTLTFMEEDDGSTQCEFKFKWLVVCSISDFLGQLFVFGIIDDFPRKKILLGTGILFFTSAIVMGFVDSFTLIARFAVFGVAAALVIVSVEIFPTEVRATAHGIAYQFTRVGAILSAVLVSYSESTFLIIAVFAIGTAIFIAVLVFALPETAGVSYYIMY